MNPTSYDQADSILNEGRDKNARKIGNNTYLERRGRKTIAVRLHGTDVVTFHANGRVQFDTGGWNTSTTRARLNAYAPAGVRFSSRKGELIMTDHGTDRPFVDGITV